MGKLRLGPIPDDKPVTRTIRLTAALDAELRAYAEAYGEEFEPISVERLIPAMLERFMRADRVFRAKVRSINPGTEGDRDCDRPPRRSLPRPG